MEIFGFHEELAKYALPGVHHAQNMLFPCRWIEVGNSGIFRPEMLGPMGFPDNVSVIAWGLSLERCCCCCCVAEKRAPSFSSQADDDSIQSAQYPRAVRAQGSPRGGVRLLFFLLLFSDRIKIRRKQLTR